MAPATIGSEPSASSPAPTSPAPKRGWGRGRAPALVRGLSARLLVLTVLFVMVAEVLIYVPSISYRRIIFLEERLAQSHLALLGLEASPDGMVDADLQHRLLSFAGSLGMTARRPYHDPLMLGPDMPERVDAEFDLRRYPAWAKVRDAAATLLAEDGRVIAVMGWSPKDPEVLIEAFLPEAPLKQDLLDYSWRILGLSLVISAITAALMFLALAWLTVRPIRRLTEAMAVFGVDPRDPARALRPSGRRDELGEAQEALAALQRDLREALAQQARLAGVGTGVAKVTHDLKGILTTALLEADRLAASSGVAAGEGREIEALAQALDRAVALCATTLRFATEGPPQIHPQGLNAAEAARAATAALATRHPGVDWRVTGDPARTVQADPTHLHRILTNLLENAAQAGAGRVTVEIGQGAAPAAPGGARRTLPPVALVVRDDGPGLPPKARAHLFEPFSGSARAGGTGLGLPIARDLALAQSGRLDLVDTGPGGTVFRLVLPAASVVS